MKGQSMSDGEITPNGAGSNLLLKFDVKWRSFALWGWMYDRETSQ